jgi:hypothetical protein
MMSKLSQDIIPFANRTWTDQVSREVPLTTLREWVKCAEELEQQLDEVQTQTAFLDYFFSGKEEGKQEGLRVAAELCDKEALYYDELPDDELAGVARGCSKAIRERMDEPE